MVENSNWSDSVLGLDESGKQLRTRDGESKIDFDPTPASDNDLVTLAIDGEMQKFLAKLCIFIKDRGNITLARQTAFEPPVNGGWRQVSWKAVQRIGAFSYSYSGFLKFRRIGRYCSLANDIYCGHIEHPTDWLSTSSFVYDLDRAGFMWRPFAESGIGGMPAQAFAPSRKRDKRNPDIIIGNDVWIGASSYIKGGVTIGDSAIVGTKSVVTKDVPPFAIVAGNPARLIRFRCSERLVERIARVQWWRYAFTSFGGMKMEDVERSLDLLEERIAAGTIAPYEPNWISVGWIKSITDELRGGR